MLLLLPALILAVVAVPMMYTGRSVGSRRVWGSVSVAAMLLVVLSRMMFGFSGPVSGEAALLLRQPPLFSLVEWGCLGLGLVLIVFTMDAPRLTMQSTGDNLRPGELSGLLLLSLAGLQLLCVVNDLMLLVFSLELISLPVSVLLVKLRGNSHRENARWLNLAGRVTQVHLLSTVVLLVGVAFLYGLTGTTCLSELQQSSSVDQVKNLFGAVTSPVGVFALVLIVAGLGIKLSLVPFHWGTEHLWQAADFPRILLAGLLPRVAAAVGLLKIYPACFPGYESTGQQLLLILAGITMLAGGVFACAATHLRKQLAALMISQGGFLLALLAVGSWNVIYPRQTVEASFSLPGFESLYLWELGSQLIALLGICAVGVTISQSDKPLDFLQELAGLMRSHPLATSCLAVFLCNLAGIPPFPGFWSRLFVLLALLSVQVESAVSSTPLFHPVFLGVTIAAIVSLLLTGVVVCRWLLVMCFDSPVQTHPRTTNQTSLAVALLLALFLLGIGLLPGPLLKQFHRANPDSPVSMSTVTQPEQQAFNSGRIAYCVAVRKSKDDEVAEPCCPTSSRQTIHHSLHSEVERRFSVQPAI